MRRFVYPLLAVLALSFAPPASAQSKGQRSHSFSFVTGTDAERAQESTSIFTRYSEIRCWNNSATPVYFGDSSAQVYPVCTDTTACPEAALSVATANLWVEASAGTPTLICITLR